MNVVLSLQLSCLPQLFSYPMISTSSPLLFFFIFQHLQSPQVPHALVSPKPPVPSALLLDLDLSVL